MENLIIVKQLPIIEERLKAMSEQIDAKVNNAVSLICSEDTVKTIKSARAELNKDFQALEERRKAVKTAVMTPYNQFENGTYKDISEKFKKADGVLKSRIDEVENGVKEIKGREVKAYFDEYLLSKYIDFVTFENANINVTLSASMKSLKEQASAFIDRICCDLMLIDTQEHKPEILVEYKKTLNCSQAITSVKTRFEAIEREKQRQIELGEKRKAEAEAVAKVQEVIQAQQPLEPPKTIIPDMPLVPGEPVKTLVFKVTAPISMLKELKKFLDDGGYQYV